ncbi:MAG TPA: M1 family aminopeptidase, partial [Chitinophagaceae bacterium]|nr:M1 family aminopeptidase [Chitinophagaceae bacterium]
GGMENASCIFYEETTASFSQTVESLLAHEIAHQWFGDMASEKSFAHLWLSEGFATYLTHIYIESKYGTDSMDHELQNDRQQVINFANRCNRPVVDSVSPLMNLLNANSYQKGSWVLHMLRCESGDSIFHEIIRAYYEKYKGGNADTRDFEAVAKEVSKKSLNNFFDQWLYKPCIPDLKITWQYLENEKKISLTVEQEQKAEIFQFPLNIKIITSPDQAAVRKIEVSQKKQTFVLPVSSKPVLVVADPFTALLFEGEINEIK